jgi:hypothetical protein
MQLFQFIAQGLNSGKDRLIAFHPKLKANLWLVRHALRVLARAEVCKLEISLVVRPI